jgi:hypothetical protein
MKRTSPIGFGKFKGKTHSVLLLSRNRNYAQWLIDQGEEFRYSATRKWILDNLPPKPKELSLTPRECNVLGEKKISELNFAQIKAYLDFQEDLQNHDYYNGLIE